MVHQAFTNRNIVFAKPGRHHAGVQGLYLYVSPDAQVRRWIYRFTSPLSHRVTETGLGLIQVLSLSEARAKALDLQRQIAQGICPVQARRVAKATMLGTLTFGQCCEAWIATHESGWKSQVQAARNLLFAHGKPLLNVQVSTVTPDMVQSALAKLWTEHPKQARRALAMWENVFNLARARGMRAGDNPAAWRGNMEFRFPRHKQINSNHYAALPYTEVPAFIKELRTRQKHSVSALALEFTILTAARTNEVCAMRWDEVDLEQRLWSLGGMRTKQGRPHQVPLSDRAMAVLQTRREGGYVFTNPRTNNPLSNKALIWVLRDMGHAETVHGFRSSFRDWAGDTTEFAREHIEECLGHTVGNATERAYRRSDALEKRRVILQTWSDYCDQT